MLLEFLWVLIKCGVIYIEHWHSKRGVSQYPTRALLCPVLLLQTLVPHYGLTSNGKCGLTDKAWNLAQGEIYAWILLQHVIWLHWLQHVTELKWMMKLCTVVFISRSQLQSASRCMFNVFLVYCGVYLMYVVLTKWLKTLQCVQKYIVLNSFQKCQSW